MHAKKRERGYNQTALIANALARVADASVENLLLRTRDTPTQTSLKRKEREKNVRNAFVLAPNVSVDPKIRYIVVDDVFTTGSTLNACAATLRDAGAESVDIVTIGHG